MRAAARGRDAAAGGAGLQLAHGGLAVVGPAAHRHLGEELGQGHRAEGRVGGEPAEQGVDERGRRPPARWRDHDDAAGVGEEGVLEVHEGQPGQQLLGPEDGVARLGGEAGAQGRVGRHGRDGGAVAEVEGEGLGERVVVQSARGQVVVAEHGLGGAGDLQARGEVAGVALRERGRGVDPRAAVGLEPGAAQDVVAPEHLGADFAGDPRLGERGDVDRDVGLVDQLVTARARPAGPARAGRRATASAAISLTAAGLTARVAATSWWSVSASAMAGTLPA